MGERRDVELRALRVAFLAQPAVDFRRAIGVEAQLAREAEDVAGVDDGDAVSRGGDRGRRSASRPCRRRTTRRVSSTRGASRRDSRSQRPRTETSRDRRRGRGRGPDAVGAKDRPGRHKTPRARVGPGEDRVDGGQPVVLARRFARSSAKRLASQTQLFRGTSMVSRVAPGPTAIAP